MSLRTNEKQTGALEAVGYLAAIAIVIGNGVGGWNGNLLIALILLAATYAVRCDVRALSRLARRNEQTQSSNTMIKPQRSSRGGRSQHTMQEGTAYEPIG